MGWLWFTVFSAESWDSISDTRWPVFEILGFLSLVGLGNCWLFRCFLSVNLGFSLDKLAILESALNKVEEVSNKLSFMCFINSFKEFSVHFSLKEFIHISLEIGFKEGLFSKSNLMHVSVHAHWFNLSLHLGSWFSLESSGISRSQKSKSSNWKFHVLFY